MGIKYKNNAITIITADIDDEVTTIPVSNAAVFPEIGAQDYCYLTIGEGNTNMEIVKVTAIVGNNLTVVRAQQDTTAKSFSSGIPIELRLTAGMLQAALDTAQSNAISSSNGYTDTSISNLSLGTASRATIGTEATHLPTVATVNTKVADGVKINTLTEKTTLVDDDLVGGENSASNPAFTRIKIECLAIFNYIKSKFAFDFDATTLEEGKTFQVVDVGDGDLKIQQVNDTFLSLSDTPEAYTAGKFLAVNSAGDAVELVDAPSSVTLYTKTMTTPYSSSVTANAFNDIGLSIASVKVPAGAKVKISGFVSVASSGAVSTQASIRLKRGSTVIGVGTSVSDRTAATASAHLYYTGDRPWAIPFEFVESPSAGTYKYSVEVSTSITTLLINRSDADADSSQYYRPISQLTVEVIK